MPWDPQRGYVPYQAEMPQQAPQMSREEILQLLQMLQQRQAQGGQQQESGGFNIEDFLKSKGKDYLKKKAKKSLFDSLLSQPKGFQGSMASTPLGATTAGNAALNSTGLGSLSNMPLGVSSGSIEGLAAQGHMPATSGASTGLGAAVPYLGLVGAGMGAKGIHDAIGQSMGRGRTAKAGALSGVGMGLGLGAAAPLLLAGGPLGWGAMGLMALAGGGLGGALGGALGNKSTKVREMERWGKHGMSNPFEGGKHDYFAGTGGEQSRDEKFLTADAIRMNPDNYNNVSDWDQWDRGKQDTFLNTLLKEGKVQEKKGGIYYDDDRATELANQIRSGTFQAQPQQMPKMMIPRKDSPGFKDGKRIDYSKRR